MNRLGIVLILSTMLSSCSLSHRNKNLAIDVQYLIKARAKQVEQILKKRDPTALYYYIHPDKGVRFSPYVSVDKDRDVVIHREELSELVIKDKIYRWGVYDGSGDPINLSFNDYLESFIYNVDFYNNSQVIFNDLVQRGNTPNNIRTAYPQGASVEFYFSGSGSSRGWQGLILVFEEKGDQWYLVGVVHDEWTI